jgi:hypothetical protein
VIGRKLHCEPLPPEVVVAQIDGDAVQPRTDITGNPGMMTKTPEEDFLCDILRIVQMTEKSPGCVQDTLFVIADDRLEIRHTDQFSEGFSM